MCPFDVVWCDVFWGDVFVIWCALMCLWVNWLSPKIARNSAPATKSDTPTSPNTAPATQHESHQWSISWHVKRHLQWAEREKSHSNLTKYCACHAKSISWLIRLTCEASFPMRGASKVTLQFHQILHLPRKMNRISDPHHIWNVISNA